MTLVATRKAFIDWIRAVTSFTAPKVVWAEQNMPRPTKSYITARLTAFVQPNQNYMGNPNASTGVATAVTDKEFTLQLHCFPAPGTDPITILLNLHDSLNTLNHYKILQDAGIAFVNNLLGPVDTTIKLDTMYEERATMDLLMRIPWSFTDANQGLIETVKIDGTAINLDGISISVYSQTITANP
jgi:hypothetical protein